MRWLQGSAILMFVCALCVGVFLGTNSWDGTVYVSSGMYDRNDDARTPAAIRKVFDFSNLEGSALTSALQNRLLSDVKVVQSQQGVGVELGHFVTRDEAGEKVFACRSYDRIELSFVADGVIESGERPIMTVEGKCDYTANINRIDPIWIPVAKILAERPGNMELSFRLTDDNKVDLKFRNMGGVWPKYWSLNSIRMYSEENPRHEITVGEGEMRRLFSRLIPVTF